MILEILGWIFVSIVLLGIGIIIADEIWYRNNF